MLLLLFCFASDKIWYTQAAFCSALFVASTLRVCVCVWLGLHSFHQYPPPPVGTTYQWKERVSMEVRVGQAGRGMAQVGERPMGTTAYGGKGFKGRVAGSHRPKREGQQ